jgi:ribosome-associated toxin RatA of RatAB toxin-antitoxin module
MPAFAGIFIIAMMLSAAPANPYEGFCHHDMTDASVISGQTRLCEAAMPMLDDCPNPTPTLAETGMTAAELAALAGDRMLLFSLPARDITAPARGGPRHYKAAVFRASAMVLPVAAGQIRQHLHDYAAYASHVPNTESVNVLARRGTHALVEYRHVFKLSMMTATTRLQLQHTQEADGSLSAVLVEGDADAALSRWQIVPLDAARTLVLYVNWADLASINMLISMLLKAQPDMAVAAPYGAAFVAMEALRRAFAGADGVAPEAGLPEQPSIPAFPRAAEHPLLARLALSGPIAFVDGGQWLLRQGEVHRQRFVAVAAAVDAEVAQAFRQSLRFDRYPEFFPLAQKVVLRPRSEGFSVDWQVGIGLGFFFVGVRYRLAYAQTAAHTLRFRQEEGDLAHIDGEWQWQSLNATQSLGALTISNHIGSEAPLVLRFARQFPYYDILAGLYMGLSSMPRMSRWLVAQAVPDEACKLSLTPPPVAVATRPARRLH